jgi:hypothetical protein
MFQHQAIRQGAHRCGFASREPANGQQKKVLLRLQPSGASHVVPVANKLANEVA